MRVLQINQVVSVTSTGRIMENLGNYLIAQGHESYIAYSGRPKAESNSSVFIVSNPLDSAFHAISTRIMDTHGLHSKLTTRKFIAWIKEVNPDVIHLHNILGYYLNYPLLFSFLKELDKPVVWTFHDFWPITGHCVYFTDVNCNKWKTQCYSCPKKTSYPASIFFDNSKSNYFLKKKYFTSLKRLHVVAISDWAKELVQQSFLRDQFIHKISNGIDSDQFIIKEVDALKLRLKYNLGNEKILIALATTWGERKGYYDYLRLADVLPEGYQIVLIGLQGLLAQNLPKGIIAIPRTDSIVDLVELYNLAEITLNLSYQETFGLTTVEGLMCGVPGIVYDATASPELINKDVGFVVKVGNINEIVEAIMLIDHNGGKEVYKDKCRQFAKVKFDSRIIHKQYLDLYKTLL